MAEHEHAIRGEKMRKTLVIQQFLGKRCGAASDIFLTERRVSDDQIELITGLMKLADGGEDILHSKLVIVFGEFRREQILANHGRVAIGFFNAQHPTGSAAEALESNSAGTGEEVEHPGALQPAAEAVENGLPYQVWGRANIKSGRDLEQTACSGSADNAHKRS